MPEYELIATDLLTQEIRDAVPFNSISYENVLNGASTLSATLPLRLPEKQMFKVTRDTLSPGRTGVYVFRGGIPVWGGILWSWSRDSSGETVGLEAADVWSYFHHRVLRTTLKFEESSIVRVAESIVDWTVRNGGDIGLVIRTGSSSTLLTQTFAAGDREVVAEIVEEMAGGDPGFDFFTFPVRRADRIENHLQFGSPLLGRQTDIEFEYGRNVTGYEFVDDAARMTFRFEAVSDGGAETKTIRTAEDLSFLDRYPLMEMVESYQDVASDSHLQRLANAGLKYRNRPVISVNVTMSPYAEPQIGSFRPGDWATLKIVDRGVVDHLTRVRIASWGADVNEERVETPKLALFEDVA